MGGREIDLSEKDEFGMDKGSGDNLHRQSHDLYAEWQLGNQSKGGSSSSCPSISMMESFCPTLWNHSTNSQTLGFSETNVQTSVSSSSSALVGKSIVMPPRLDMGGAFLPPGPGILPPNLSHFPTDSAFIERAARFSCFNGGSFKGIVNPINVPESSSPYSRDQISRTDAIKDVLIYHGSNNGSPMRDLREESLHGRVSTNEPGEPEFTKEETRNLGNIPVDSSSQGLSAKRRKMRNQDMELDQERSQRPSIKTVKGSVESKHKADKNSSTMAAMKPPGKQAVDSCDSPREDCIHLRVRHGQATNSHSHAERVRRERISERMKFLQDLVPGCGKVAGKALMLDEIINYVQSLQRQVEFLSMKLAAVYPRLDFNIEGILPKDFLQSLGAASSSMGFPHGLMHSQLHLPQQNLVMAGMSGITHPSDALRRAIDAQLTMINGYKEPTSQMPSAWDDKLTNTINMDFSTSNPSLNTHELNGKT